MHILSEFGSNFDAYMCVFYDCKITLCQSSISLALLCAIFPHSFFVVFLYLSFVNVLSPKILISVVYHCFPSLFLSHTFPSSLSDCARKSFSFTAFLTVSPSYFASPSLTCFLLSLTTNNPLPLLDGYYVAHKPITLFCIFFMFIEMIFIHCHSRLMFAMKSISMCND